MILAWKKHKGVAILIIVAIFASVFFLEGNQRQAHAAVNPDLGNLGSEIICFVFSELNKVGSPIPVLNAGDCQNPPSVPPQCTDGIDNDGDGAIDFPADSGCTSATDNTEAPNPTPPPSEPLQCNDGVDNDADGKVDLLDPGCLSSTDNNETDESSPRGDNGTSTPPTIPPTTPPTPPTDSGTSSSGGGGGGGGRSGGSSRPSAPVLPGKVLGVKTCEEYLLKYIKFGTSNDPNEVLKLQRFLRDLGGFSNLKETSIYDQATYEAVHAFQKTNAAQILTPWGATRSTGYVYYTTKKTINEIHCKFIRDFPLNSEQQAEIARVKALGGRVSMPNPSLIPFPLVPQNIKPTVPETPSSRQSEVGGAQTDIGQSATVEVSASSTPTKVWFRNLFNWFRAR